MRALRYALLCSYGAMMWALGKVVQTPEVMRVYVGSFWEYPIADVEFKHLFEIESQDLMRDLANLPRFAAVRKINELVKRARALKVGQQGSRPHCPAVRRRDRCLCVSSGARADYWPPEEEHAERVWQGGCVGGVGVGVEGVRVSVAVWLWLWVCGVGWVFGVCWVCGV